MADNVSNAEGSDRPTLEQVAERAGVSIATASRVVTGSVPVSAARRQRVEAAIEELGYVPDERARDLRRGAQRTVGFLVPNLASPLYNGVYRRLVRALRERDGVVVAFELDDDGGVSAVEALVRGQARAIVVAAPNGLPEEALRVLQRRRTPVVFFDEPPRDAGASWVAFDERRGQREMTEHLVELGHRRIAYLAGPSGVPSAAAGLEGYREALAASGVGFEEALVGGRSWSFEEGYRAALALIALDEPPTAILAAHPLAALGALVALRGAGLRVPDDVSLATTFEIEAVRVIDPPLTCLEGVEERLAAGIIDALDAAPRTVQTLLHAPVARRGSTAPPPARVGA